MSKPGFKNRSRQGRGGKPVTPLRSVLDALDAWATDGSDEAYDRLADTLMPYYVDGKAPFLDNVIAQIGAGWDESRRDAWQVFVDQFFGATVQVAEPFALTWALLGRFELPATDQLADLDDVRAIQTRVAEALGLPADKVSVAPEVWPLEDHREHVPGSFVDYVGVATAKGLHAGQALEDPFPCEREGSEPAEAWAAVLVSIDADAVTDEALSRRIEEAVAGERLAVRYAIDGQPVDAVFVPLACGGLASVFEAHAYAPESAELIRHLDSLQAAGGIPEGAQARWFLSDAGDEDEDESDEAGGADADDEEGSGEYMLDLELSFVPDETTQYGPVYDPPSLVETLSALLEARGITVLMPEDK